MTIVFYISGHGFGHATRNLDVISQIQRQRPDAHIVIRTSVPRWFIVRSAGSAVDVQACETDTGVAQIDSLRLDEAETARQAAAFYSTFPARVEAEARVLADLGASVVVGDIPPLAFAAAANAGVPSVALANFTWDWIYEMYPAFTDAAPGVLDTMRLAYSQASLALRLPFAGGFEPMRAVTIDAPLVARRSRLGREETRRRLMLDGARPIVLASFGGHGTRLPFEKIARGSDATLMVTDDESTGEPGSSVPERLKRIAMDDLERLDIRYEDLVAASDVVVSKPGYGIVSECIANDAALLYTSRGRFAENEIIVAGMHRVLRCRFIPQDELRAGRWQDAINALLGQPAPSGQMASGGGATVAAAVIAAGSLLAPFPWPPA